MNKELQQRLKELGFTYVANENCIRYYTDNYFVLDLDIVYNPRWYKGGYEFNYHLTVDNELGGINIKVLDQELQEVKKLYKELEKIDLTTYYKDKK